jgi:uncharacterized radical SAM protein YgiQ
MGCLPQAKFRSRTVRPVDISRGWRGAGIGLMMVPMPFIPALPGDLAGRGLGPGGLDAVIVTGDAYVDHVSFGAALIGRLLEAEGYAVGILARPDPDDTAAFRLLGRPRLAFLVTAGALDSMVSSYTANKKPRAQDDYAPGGKPALCLRGDGSIGPGKLDRPCARPDRALIAYATKCREAYKGVAIILGGLEASLRRFSHYDYWSDSPRRSVLLDSKADLLVYGMGETAILQIMRRLAAGAEASSIRGVRGTVWWSSSKPALPDGSALELPPYVAITADTADKAGKTGAAGKAAFAESFRIQYRNTDPHSAKTLIEETTGRWIVQEPPAFPLTGEELDRVHELPYERDWHSMYARFGGVPALSEIKYSLVSGRGCFGACSFCSLTFHQGRAVSARSHESILREARHLTHLPDFKGYIHDVGGPTANFRRGPCDKMEREGACVDRRCLAPTPCPALEPDHRDYLALLRKLRHLPGIKKVFVRSGLRFDYLMMEKDEEFFRELVQHHVSGQLKVAPEHISNKVLALMGKPRREIYQAFAQRYASLNLQFGLRQYLVPYFISAHPGAGLAEAIELAEYLRDTGFVPDQVQDFYPTPGTLSTAMYWTGLDPLTGTKVHVATGARERALQRALLQYRKPEHRDLVREALLQAGRGDLIGPGKKCLIPR